MIASNPVSLLIADAHTLFGVALADWMKRWSQIAHVDWAARPTAAVRKMVRMSPKVMLVGTNFPDADLQAVLDGIRAVDVESASRVVVLDSDLSISNLRKAVHFGANGYWLKHRTPREILQAVLAAARNEHTFCPRSRKFVLKTARGVRCTAPTESTSFRELTPREFEISMLIAEGYSATQCAKKLGLAKSTVDNFKWRAMKKLGVHRAAEMSRMAREEGLLG